MIEKHELKIGIKGQHRRTVWNAFTGELIPEECDFVDNLIVSNGPALIAACLAGHSHPSYIGVGSGTTAATVDDVNLETPIGSRLLIRNTTVVGAVAVFSAFFTSADNNSALPWTEAVLATELSGDDTIISRALYSIPFTKDNTKTAQDDWILTVQAV